MEKQAPQDKAIKSESAPVKVKFKHTLDSPDTCRCDTCAAARKTKKPEA